MNSEQGLTVESCRPKKGTRKGKISGEGGMGGWNSVGTI